MPKNSEFEGMQGRAVELKFEILKAPRGLEISTPDIPFSQEFIALHIPDIEPHDL